MHVTLQRCESRTARHTSRARDHPSPKWLNKLRKSDHKLLSPSIDDSSDTMFDISDFRWWTSILTRQRVTCLNLKYPLMLLQVAKSMFLEMRREPLAMAISHPRDVALLSRSDCSTVVFDKNLDGPEKTITCSRPP